MFDSRNGDNRNSLSPIFSRVPFMKISNQLISKDYLGKTNLSKLAPNVNVLFFIQLTKEFKTVKNITCDEMDGRWLEDLSEESFPEDDKKK